MYTSADQFKILCVLQFWFGVQLTWFKIEIIAIDWNEINIKCIKNDTLLIFLLHVFAPNISILGKGAKSFFTQVRKYYAGEIVGVQTGSEEITNGIRTHYSIVPRLPRQQAQFFMTDRGNNKWNPHTIALFHAYHVDKNSSSWRTKSKLKQMEILLISTNVRSWR